MTLSILAGAVLFRLGRGLPQLALEELRDDEVAKLAAAFRQVSKRLVVFFYVVGFAILSQLAVQLVPATLSSNWSKTVVAVSLFLSAFVCLRAVLLVRGDADLVDLQAKLLEDNHKRRAVREALKRADDERPLKPPPGYGGLASFS